MPEIKFYNRTPVPMEMHKVKIVQKLTLLPVRERLKKLEEAGFNTFLLHNELSLYNIKSPRYTSLRKSGGAC